MLNKKINIGFLYFILPLLFFLAINFSKETDIWFIFSHGRYILNNGFPHTEFLTIHQGLHFVMQQWGFSFIMYILYHNFGTPGIVIFIGIINFLIVLFLYKLCVKISNNVYFSCLIVAIIDLILEMTFISPRPQIITYLFLIIIIYLLERKDKTIYFLPLISLLEINIHSSMWLMIFIITLPYICEYIIKKDKRIYELLIVLLISFLVGFINPYGIETMTYPFKTYGIDTINKLVIEMHPIGFKGNKTLLINSLIFLSSFFLFLITMIIKRKKYSIHIILLFLGLGILAFLNLRNISIFLICVIPFITISFSKIINNKISIFYLFIVFIIIISVFIIKNIDNDYRLDDKKMNGIVRYLDSKEEKNLRIFNYYENGPYLEYHNYKTYIDSRAEVFIKKFNKKSDVLDEYDDVLKANISYQDFINKYNFTHFIVKKDTKFYHFLKDNNYKVVYHYKEYQLFENKSE